MVKAAWRLLRSLACLSGMAGAGLPLAAAATEPLCRVDLRLEPEHPWVGQQVTYRLRIERRRDVADVAWERAPSFPALRSEWLPPIASADALAQGEGWRATEERRALFPARPGRLEIPRATLRCESVAGAELVTVAARELEVRDIPDDGRPTGWRGLVGPVDVRLRVEPPQLPLGSSARVTLQISGAANVWDAEAALARALAAGGAEHFGRPRELSRDAGRSLVMREHRGFDVVPRSAGTFAIPALRIAWWDPAAERFRETRTAEATLVVTPAGSRVAERSGPAAEAERPRPGSDAAAPAADGEPQPATGGALPSLAILAVLAAAGLALVAWARRRRRAQGPSQRRDLEEALRAASLAEGRADFDAMAVALAQGLRGALSHQLPGASALSAEECFERSEEPGRELALLLLRVERARFAPGEAAAELRDVRSALERKAGAGPREAPEVRPPADR